MKNSTVGDATSSGASGANTETIVVEVAAAVEEVGEEAGRTGVKETLLDMRNMGIVAVNRGARITYKCNLFYP